MIKDKKKSQVVLPAKLMNMQCIECIKSLFRLQNKGWITWRSKQNLDSLHQWSIQAISTLCYV